MIANTTKFGKLETHRTVLFEISLIITLVLLLSAFNWKSYDRMALPDYYRDIDDTPVELAPVTIQKPPEPPKMKKPMVVYSINIVDNEDFVEDDYVINAEADPLDTIEVYVPMPLMKIEDESSEGDMDIFTVVESMPEFPGGENAFLTYLKQNLIYPQLAIEAGISGKVYVTFVVEKDGSITDVKLLRGIGGGCDEEALRVVRMMPDWKPGLQRLHPVRVQFIMDVKFTLTEM